MTGVVEIVLSDTEGYFEGIVKEAYRQIELFDRLFPYQRRSPKIAIIPLPEAGTAKKISGKIISGADNPVMFSENSLAFIDKGSSDGIKAGQWYSVYRENTYKDSETKEEVSLSPTVYGTFFVLDTKDKTSTVFITDSKRSITPSSLFMTKFKAD